MKFIVALFCLAADYWGACDRWESGRSGLEKLQQNVCRREREREKRHCLDAAERRRARSTQGRRPPTGGLAPRISLAQKRQVPASSPIHIRIGRAPCRQRG